MMSKIYRLVGSIVIICYVMAIYLPASRAEQPSQKSVLFLIDTSGSMRGDKLLGVKKAFKTIIKSLPSDIAAGVITFSNTANVLLPLTTDRNLLELTVSNLQAKGETAMFDAVLLGLENFPIVTSSRLILLTDGEDTVSKINFAQMTSSIASKNIPIDSIGLQTTPNQGVRLRTLSELSGGNFYSLSNIDKLIEAYQKSLNTITNTPSTPNPVEVDLPKSSPPLNVNWRFAPYIIALFFFFSVLFLQVLIKKLISRNKTNQSRSQFLEKYEIRKLKVSTTIKAQSTSNYDFVLPKIRNWIISKLNLIHSEVSFERVVSTLFGIFLAAFVLFWIMFTNIFVALVFSTITVPLIFNAYIKNRRKKQIRLFADELPDLLHMLASALKSGLSLSQGLEAFALENTGEVARQIRRANSEILIGSTIEDSLMKIATRMENEDLKWTITALSVQRSVGGGFANILSTTYATVKERAEIRREVTTLSAEGKLSAYILMALPLGIFSFLFLSKRDYISILWTSLQGILLLGVIVLALSIGWIWIKKIIEIKI